ncbi:hypothetical protein MUP29_14210 [bacterium]|nr:hypothetical protein [bacterium]
MSIRRLKVMYASSESRVQSPEGKRPCVRGAWVGVCVRSSLGTRNMELPLQVDVIARPEGPRQSRSSKANLPQRRQLKATPHCFQLPSPYLPGYLLQPFIKPGLPPRHTLVVTPRNDAGLWPEFRVLGSGSGFRVLGSGFWVIGLFAKSLRRTVGIFLLGTGYCSFKASPYVRIAEE